MFVFFPWSWLEDSCFFTWWNCYHVENGFWFPSNDTCASLPRGCRWLPPGRKDIVCPLQWNSNRDATLVSCVFSAPGCFNIFWENPHYLFRYFYIYIYVYIYISLSIYYIMKLRTTPLRTTPLRSWKIISLLLRFAFSLLPVTTYFSIKKSALGSWTLLTCY